MTSARQGPPTDIYGLAATMYAAIAGATPPPAIDRMLDDTYRPLVELGPTGFAPALLAGIDAGLGVRASQRPQTIVPTQALFLLNNGLIRKQATTLANKLIADEKNDSARLDVLWLRVLNRPITASERNDAIAFLGKLTISEPARWMELCHSLLASNEFVFRL